MTRRALFGVRQLDAMNVEVTPLRFELGDETMDLETSWAGVQGLFDEVGQREALVWAESLQLDEGIVVTAARLCPRYEPDVKSV